MRCVPQTETPRRMNHLHGITRVWYRDIIRSGDVQQPPHAHSTTEGAA